MSILGRAPTTKDLFVEHFHTSTDTLTYKHKYDVLIRGLLQKGYRMRETHRRDCDEIVDRDGEENWRCGPWETQFYVHHKGIWYKLDDQTLPALCVLLAKRQKNKE